MTTGVKIALGIAVLAAVGVGVYEFKDGAENTSENATTTAQLGSTGKKMAFEQFVKQGGTYKCTVHQSVNGSDVTGTVYMDKGLLRGEFAASYGAQSMNVTFVMRDGYSYTWSNLMPTGFKMKIDPSTQPGSTSSPTAGNITAGLQQIGDYDCEAWNGDATKFAIPTNITFEMVSTAK